MGSVGQVLEFDEQIAKCREQFEKVLAQVTRAGEETLDAVERGAFAGLLELGRRLMEARLVAEAAQDQAAEVKGPDGRKLPYHSQKAVTYRSVGGASAEAVSGRRGQEGHPGNPKAGARRHDPRARTA